MELPFYNHDLLGLAISQVKFSNEEAKYIIYQILNQLSELHRKGYTHRDVKSSNVLLKNTGEVALADFGQAIPTHKVAEGFKCGTLQYRAPEMQLGFELENSHGMRVKEILKNNCLADGELDEEIDWIEQEIQEITAALEREGDQNENMEVIRGENNENMNIEDQGTADRNSIETVSDNDLIDLPECNQPNNYLDTRFKTESINFLADSRIQMVKEINNNIRFASKLFPNTQRNKTSIHLMTSPDFNRERVNHNFKLDEEPEVVKSDFPRTISSIGVSCTDPSITPHIPQIKVESEISHYRSNIIAKEKAEVLQAPELIEIDGLKTPCPQPHIIHSQNTPLTKLTKKKEHLFERRSTHHTISVEDSTTFHDSFPKIQRFDPSLPLYDERLDVWSAGCVLAELLLGRPLFSRIRKPQDLSRAFVQLFGRTLTTSLLSQALATSPGSFCLSKKVAPNAQNAQPSALLAFFRKRAPNADQDLVELLIKMLSPELTDRPTCEEALTHPCFDGFNAIQAKVSLHQKLSSIKFNCHESSARKRALANAQRRKLMQGHLKHTQLKRPLGSNSLNLSSQTRRTVPKGKKSCPT